MTTHAADEQITTDPDAWRKDWPPVWGFRRILECVAVVFLALPILAAAIIPALIGAAPMTVISGSMEPVLSPGDVVVMETPNPNDLRLGDIVSYQPAPELDFGYSGITTTHRIISLHRENGTVTKIQLKGDANPTPDPLLASPEQIHGRMLYTVPYAGIPALAARNAGIDLLAVLGVGIGGYVVLSQLRKCFRY